MRGLWPSSALAHAKQRVTETRSAARKSKLALAAARVLGGNPGLDAAASYPSKIKTALWGGTRWRAHVGGVG